jgi:hypothetical protein
MRIKRDHPYKDFSAGWAHGTSYAHWGSDPFMRMPFFGVECDQESLCFARDSQLLFQRKTEAF